VLPNNQKVLLTDTVGFIKKLPHTVIESFKATLEEVTEADLLLHIVDASHPQFLDQMDAVDAVIAELQAHGKQTITVFNKVDRFESPDMLAGHLERHPGSVAISARTGLGLDTLLDELIHRLSSWRLRGHYRIPVSESALLAEIHRVGHVTNITYEEDVALVHANIPPELQPRLASYQA